MPYSSLVKTRGQKHTHTSKIIPPSPQLGNQTKPQANKLSPEPTESFVGKRTSETVLCPILWGIKYHIFMPVRLDEISNSIVDTPLKFVYVYQKQFGIVHTYFFLIMSTLKGDLLVKIFHFTIFLFWPYVKKVYIV
jgi:hypothetical protein